MNSETNWVLPVVVYMCMCCLITLVQMAVLYTRDEKTPDWMTAICKCVCCLFCTGLIWFFSGYPFQSNYGWECVIILTILMFSSCAVTLYDSNIGQIFDISYYLNNSTTDEKTVVTVATDTTV